MFDSYADVKYVRTPKDIYISNIQPLAIENSTWIGEETINEQIVGATQPLGTKLMMYGKYKTNRLSRWHVKARTAVHPP